MSSWKRKSSLPRLHGSANRRGNAAVELALTLPVMVSIVFGSIEICSILYSRQAIEATAHECARVAANATATNSDVEARMAEILSQRGVVGASVTTIPANIAGIERGTQITVTVAAPVSANTWVPARFYGSDSIQASCVVVKEL